MVARPPRSPPPMRTAPAKVQITTGAGHPAITADMLHSARTPPTPLERPVPLRRPPTSEQESLRLKYAWEDVERRRLELEARWPSDVERPRIATRPAIDWEHQPPIPAEKIDWSRQGVPLRVQPTAATFVMLTGILMSVLGSAAMFYWQVRTHLADRKIHVPADGVPWGIRATFETRPEAAENRKILRDRIVRELREDQEKSRTEILGAIEGRRRPRRRQR